MTVTITGNVGNDGYDKGIFGTGALTNVAGQPFTLTYTFDETKGQDVISYSYPGGPAYKSDYSGMGASSPGKATLQIGAASYTFPASTSSEATRIAGGGGVGEAAFSVYVVDAINDSEVLALYYPEGTQAPVLAYQWDSSFSDPSLACCTYSFNISVNTMNGYLSAGGSLIASSITEVGPLTSSAGPRIFRDGTIDITGTTQSALVGQKISLLGSLSIGATVSPGEPWIVAGTTVGGYTPVESTRFVRRGSGQVIPADFSQGTTAFYWTVPGIFQVTFSCTLASGQVASAQATFEVLGPTSPFVGTTLGAPAILAQSLSFGDPRTIAAGIVFTAAANVPSTNPGTFEWVQLLDANSVVITDAAGDHVTCSDVTGGELDNEYPYPAETTTETSDSPRWPLPRAPYNSMSFTFMARMFLMWTSNLPSSIPVPLGYVQWGFSISATGTLATQLWMASGDGQANGFQQDSFYPTWTSVFSNGLVRSEACSLIPARGGR